MIDEIGRVKVSGVFKEGKCAIAFASVLLKSEVVADKRNIHTRFSE